MESWTTIAIVARLSKPLAGYSNQRQRANFARRLEDNRPRTVTSLESWTTIVNIVARLSKPFA
ncbi:hypothetical protein [Novipirellula caenicola]|uniref:hypothetical protein n=1 Tax=Novipirellula caenicola TaxID=1536901 RepID=UPI0031EB5042